jgi:endogenous inhibitor of DNA gyrase (YacG/DUF329 family)
MGSDTTSSAASGNHSPCPICKRPVTIPPADADQKARGCYPFCTDRCRLVDLGRWLSGAYQIPVRDTDDDEERDGGTDFDPPTAPPPPRSTPGKAR